MLIFTISDKPLAAAPPRSPPSLKPSYLAALKSASLSTVESSPKSTLLAMLKPTKFTDKEKMLKLYFVMEYVGGGESFNKVAKGRLRDKYKLIGILRNQNACSGACLRN